MSILATLNRQIQANMYRDREDPLARWLRGDDSDEGTDSGVSVNERTAMNNPIVWKCVIWRAKMFGMLPHKVGERIEIMGRSAQREAKATPQFMLPYLIHSSPNPTITSKGFFGYISADVHLWGNFYAWIERGSATGRILHLWRICPDRVRIEQDDTSIWYIVSDGSGHQEKFFPSEILHIRGLGYDGIRGYSAIQMLKQTIGWTKATRQFSARFYKNAFRPSGLIFASTVTKEPAKTEMIANLKASGKEGGLALLEGGTFDYKPLTIPQDDAQFLQTMEFQDEDLAGAFEVKPHEIGIMRHMTNNNVEQETISSVTRCLQPFAVDVEQWCDLQLLSDAPSSGRGGGTERDRYFHQTELKALMRGDTAAQTAHIIAMRDRGIYDGNDCADYLGNQPFAGGDVRVINAAYVPLDMLKEIASKRGTAPAPGAPNSDGGPAPDPATANSLAQMFAHVFRDAVGRAIGRKKDREKAIVTIFAPVLGSINDTIGAGADDAFILDYLNALGQRSTTWEESQANAISETELNRAVQALLGRQS